MRKNDFKKLGTKTILGKRVSESKTTRFYKIAKCCISGANVEEAVARYVQCVTRRGNEVK